jgi:hypothetical protein
MPAYAKKTTRRLLIAHGKGPFGQEGSETET